MSKISKRSCVVAAILGAPALLAAFLALGGVMSIVGPILAVLFGLGTLIHWIARGS